MGVAKLVVKWFYKTVVLQYQLPGTAPRRQAWQRMRKVEKMAANDGGQQYRAGSKWQVVLALPLPFYARNIQLRDGADVCG
jgi:hypothetical protein